MRQFSGSIKARALEDLLHHSIHYLHSSLGPHEDIDPVDIMKGSEELFEDNFSQEASCASQEEGLSSVEFFHASKVLRHLHILYLN